MIGAKIMIDAAFQSAHIGVISVSRSAQYNSIVTILIEKASTRTVVAYAELDLRGWNWHRKG